MEHPGAGKSRRYGMVVDLDRCNGCGACMMACAVENNVPPGHPQVSSRTGITWLRVYRVTEPGGTRAAFVPMLCQQCGVHTPCASVCPQNAVELDAATGIVAQIPTRCLGCRYCMAACPYHARAFNWWDPDWPGQLTETLSPDVSTRTRGVVEKCSFCSHRFQAARTRQAAEGGPADTLPEYTPACVEACPAQALVFGDLGDTTSAVARLAAEPTSFRLLEPLGTDPKIYFRTARPWVRRLTEGHVPAESERRHG
jgi:Fe-S-cluster-containing dehydrogenase component